MFNAEQTAKDLTGILQSSDALINVNVKSYRAMRLQNLVDFGSLMTAGRNGKFGAAVLTLEPVARGNQKNVLLLDWIFPVVSMECPAINDIQTGTNLTAYQLAQIVADNVHNYADEALGTFNIDGIAIEDEKEFVFYGCISKRTNFHILGKNGQTVRVGQLAGTIGGGNLTIASALNPSADVYYTTDGSFPAKVGNPAAILYSAPFPVTSGQVIRAVGYEDGFNNSACMNKIIP